MTGVREAPGPHFLIIGAPKCGTTALAQHLGAHPEILVSRPKEPHFFDGDYGKNLAEYRRAAFPGWRPGLVAGEATPSYLMVPPAAGRIHAALPAARLVAMLRHPVDRAYSSWWMFRARGMEPLAFEDAIAADEARGDAPFDDRAWRTHLDRLAAGKPIELRTYLEAGYYARHLRRYFDLFDRGQVKIVFSHDFARDPSAVVRETFTFIGVDPEAVVVDNGRANEALGAGARPLLRALQMTGLMRLRTLVPERVRSRLKARLARLGAPPTLAPDTRARLCRHFEPHVESLEALLQVQLPGWKR